MIAKKKTLSKLPNAQQRVFTYSLAVNVEFLCGACHNAVSGHGALEKNYIARTIEFQIFVVCSKCGAENIYNVH